jgi:endo-1,4-beta-xylanase
MVMPLSPRRLSWSTCALTSCFAAFTISACVSAVGDDGSGGSSGGSGGTDGSGGASASGGVKGSGGSIGSGGATASGGTKGSGGATASGGSTASGGATASGGSTASGGATASGGNTASGGATASGGSTASGGAIGFGGKGAATASGGFVGGGGRGGSQGAGARGGSPGTGNTPGSGGTTGAAGSPGDACANTTTLSGGTNHASNNASGMASGMAWTIWSNGSGGAITTYDPTPAFKATWANSGDYLARIGLQWNASKTFDQYGTITAQFNSKKTGTGGGYSYIGVYGWSVSPCVEFYIVDDSFNKMPVNPGSTTNKGTAMIDGGTYTLYTRATTGTGGSKCPNTTQWTQFYSVRQTARTCGQISITEHFKAWAAAGMALGKMDQAQLLVEVGGGSGSVDFPVANVTAQ